VSQKAGQVKTASVPTQVCLNRGVHPTSMSFICVTSLSGEMILCCLLRRRLTAQIDPTS
jgi:hypothetical protein